jgi:hypothetical protein
MSKIYSPKIVQDSLVMCLDPSQNKSYPTTDLPVKDSLILWLDAADDTVFSYSSGTVVSQWRDKSGLNNHVIQPTVANQPSRSTIKNSRKTVVFDGSNDNLYNTGNVFPSSTTNYTKIAVVYQTSTATTGNVISSKTATVGSSTAHAFYFGGTTYIKLWHDVDFVTSSTALNTNTLGIISGTYVNSTGLGSLYVNGTASGTGTAANRNIRQDIQIGGIIDCCFFTGEICEVLVFSKVLSTTELKQVHTYLGQKWGISNTDRSIVDLAGNDDNGLFGNGTVANMPAYDYYNKGTLKFDGSNDYVSVGANAILRGNSISLGVFFKTINNGQSVQFIAGYGDTGVQGYWLGVVGGPIRFFVGNGSTSLQLNSGISPNNDQIYYVVGTYDGTNQRIYVDGVLMASSTSVNGSLSYTGMTDGFLIGQVQGFTGGRYLTGNIYAMQVYNRALSATEVAQNYEAQKSKFANTIVQQGLVLNLDAGNIYSYAGAGTVWYDVSGNGKIGTLTGGVTYSSLYGGDFILDGVNGYIQTDLNQNTDNAQITWEAWFWDNSPGGFNSNTAIISNYGAVGTTPYTSLHILDTGNVFFGQRNSSGTADDAVYGSSICDSVWHHLVGVVDGSNMHIYVDGIVRASKTKITGTTTSGQNLVIGGNHLGRYQSCRIASARCYNIALSAAQVLQNYNATKGRFGL